MKIFHITAVVFLLLLPVSAGLLVTSDLVNFKTIQLQFTVAQTTNSTLIGSGVGEVYTLQYGVAPTNIQGGIGKWHNLLQNISTPPSAYKNNFKWKTFELRFTFQNLNSTPENPYSNSNISMTSSGSLNFTALDGVISSLTSSGYNVILDDYDYANFGSHQWLLDWVNTTLHYSNNPNVVAFALYNEPTKATWSSNVTNAWYNDSASVVSAYFNATLAIRQIDPGMKVIWRVQGDSLNETCVQLYNSFCWALAPKFELSNVMYDFHIYSPNTDQYIKNEINTAVAFSKTYNVPVISLEVDVVGGNPPQENLTATEYAFSTLNEDGIPSYVWAYSLFPYYWIPVLDSASTIVSSTTNSSTYSSTNYSDSQVSLQLSNSSTTQSVQNSTEKTGNGSLAADQKRLTAVADGSSTSIAVFGLGSILILTRLRNKKSNSLLSNWRW